MQMNGLSFYYTGDDKYIHKQIDGSKQIKSNIEEIVRNKSCDIINMYHDGNYIIIPTPLFDENMCESYLHLKGHTLDGGSELENDKFITYYSSGEFTYISIFSKSLYYILEKSAQTINIIPTIERAISYDKDLAHDNISIILSGCFIHITHQRDGVLNFCESLPLESSSDVALFMSMVIEKVTDKDNLEITVLYQPEDSNLVGYLGKRYKMKEITKCNYFAV